MTEALQESDPKPYSENTDSKTSHPDKSEQEEEEAFQRLLDEMDQELRRLRQELRREQDRAGRGRWSLMGLPMPGF